MTLLPLDISCKLKRLSVITVVFNGKYEIEKTIESVIAQDYHGIEYIVIDGGSTDGTKDVILRYLDKLDVFISEPDDGVYDAMNKAVRHACGEFLLFMNSGDVFARGDSISSVMKLIESGPEQVVFGQWFRSISAESMQLCRPVLEKGLFNHQAVIYSRRIHDWHGGYMNVKGLTTADYLFFVTLFNSTLVTCRVIDTPLAIIDVNGLSAGPQTLSQKYAIDFICGRASKLQLLIVLVLHPLYRRAKAVWRWVR